MASSSYSSSAGVKLNSTLGNSTSTLIMIMIMNHVCYSLHYCTFATFITTGYEQLYSMLRHTANSGSTTAGEILKSTLGNSTSTLSMNHVRYSLHYCTFATFIMTGYEQLYFMLWGSSSSGVGGYPSLF